MWGADTQIIWVHPCQNNWNAILFNQYINEHEGYCMCWSQELENQAAKNEFNKSENHIEKLR